MTQISAHILKILASSDMSLFEKHVKNAGLKIIGINNQDKNNVQSESISSIASIITEDTDENITLNDYQKLIKRIAENHNYIIGINESDEQYDNDKQNIVVYCTSTSNLNNTRHYGNGDLATNKNDILSYLTESPKAAVIIAGIKGYKPSDTRIIIRRDPSYDSEKFNNRNYIIQKMPIDSNKTISVGPDPEKAIDIAIKMFIDTTEPNTHNNINY